MIYTQKDFIKLISEESGYYQNAIKDILDAAQAVSERLMIESTAEDPAKIKVFEGLTIGAKYYREREALNPKNLAKIVTPEHVYPFAKYSQAFALRVRDGWENNKREG